MNGNSAPDVVRHFIVHNYPVVVSTVPSNGSYNIITTSTIAIRFDHEMDGTTVEPAITISPDVQRSYSWSGDKKTVTLTPSQELSPDTTYTVTVSDAAKDVDGNQLDGDKDGHAGGSYTFNFSTKPAKIKVLSLTHEYYDGKYWVKAGSKTVTAQLVDDAGNAMASTTPPHLKWNSPSGGTQPVSFGSGGTAATTWTGTISVSSGSDGQATFSGENNTPVSGITSFMIDTKPPKIESAGASSPNCNCPAGPLAFKYTVTDSGSGVGTVTPIGLGLEASGCYSPGTYKYGASPVKDKVGNSTSLSGSLSVIQNKCTNPDDNYSVIIQNIPGSSSSSINIAGKKIALLGNGYVYAAQRFLADKVKTESTIIDADFSPEMYTEYPLLLVPTGGLSGLIQSESFKARLASYVEKGGTLLVFSQNQGYEFEALPGGQVAGYGYSNDQQCFTNAAYIKNWHQILSGQAKANLDLNVDGFYTALPAVGESILTRVSNGQSAMVVYPYGLGSVIATTMYTDWGYSVSQYTSQEISLVRDIVAWAKLPMTLPEARPGGSVTVPTPVTNQTSGDGATIKIIIRDPSKDIVAELISPAALPAGESMEISVPYSLETTSPLGIWWINYEVFDAAGNSIQPEQEGARFAVATRPENPAQQAGLFFSVMSDSENYPVGSSAAFTIMVFNSSAVEKTITAKYDDQSQVVTVAPNSSVSIAYTKPITSVNTRGTWLYAYFYDQSGAYLGSALKRYWSGWPSGTATIQADKTYYAKGENVALSATVANRNFIGWQAGVVIRITDPQNTRIFEETNTVNLSSEGSAAVTARFTLPAASLIGTYMVRCEVWSGTTLITSSSARLELPQSRITVVPNPPAAFSTGDNLVPFVLTNSGTIAVSSGMLAVAMKDPTGSVVHNVSRPFTLGVGETKTMDILLSLPSLKKNNYSITYSQSDETRIGQESAFDVPNTVFVIPVFDKASYRIRETVNLSLDVKNSGKFNLDNLTLAVSEPDSGYLDTTSSNTSAGQETLYNYALSLPVTLASGQHTVRVAATLPSGDSWTVDSVFVVPPAELQLALNGPSYAIGDQITMTVNNQGGVDSDNSYSVKLYDSTRRLVYEKTGNMVIEAGNAGVISFPVPATIMSDSYLLNAELLDAKTANRSILRQSVTIAGISSTIAVRTDKDIYLSTDQKKAIADVVVPSASSAQGSLNLKALTALPWFPTATSTGDAMIDTNVTRNMRNLYSGAEISNSYIDVVVAANGRFTIGTINGDPDNPNDNNAKLLYGHPSPWSSFTTAKIDSSYYALGYGLAPTVLPYYDGSSILTEWKIGNVRIIQKISIAYSDSGLPDTIQTEYLGKNEDSTSHAIGFRIMWDTQLGSNDGAPFQLPNVGNVTTEMDFLGSDVPLWLSMNSLTSPTVVGKGLILGLGAIVPDRLVLARWNNIYNTTWDYTISPSASVTGDSAVGLWWNAQPVAAGGVRKSKTFYGVGKVAAASAQLSTTLYAPNVLAFDPSKEEPLFSVTAYVRNNTSLTATSVKAAIQLPDGLALEQDTVEKSIGSINAYQVAQVTWRVRATGTTTGDLTYSVAASASNLQGITATTKILVPAWIGKDNSAGYVVWEANVPLDTSLAQTAEQQMVIPSSVTGKLYLMGTLYAPSGQTLSQDSKPFYIIQGNIALLFAPDKKVYKPGETVTISGEVINLASAPETNLALLIDRKSGDGSSQTVLSETFGVDGSGSHVFTTTMTADAMGAFILKGSVTKNSSSVAEITEQYETANPAVAASVSAPETAGDQPFSVSVEIRNTGRTNATVSLNSSVDNQIRQIELLPGETKRAEYTAQITSLVTYSFVFTGDLTQTITRTVNYGLSGSIAIGSQTYPEGEVAVPVAVVNTGVLDTVLDVTYTLQPSGDTRTRTYYLPKGTSAADTLHYTLPEGVYQLSAVSSRLSTTVVAVLTIKKENRVDLTMDVGTQTGTLVPVTVSISNLGYNAVAGTIRNTILDSQGATVWSSEQPITLLTTDASRSADFAIDAEVLSAGNYTVTVEFLNGGGQRMATGAKPLTIMGPHIRISQLPSYQSFASGQEATFVFKVKNTGNQGGAADIRVSAYDLIDATRTVWLTPQEEKEVFFSFLLPNDLEEKDYFAEYELNSQGASEKGQVPYHLEGINLTVSATLDKSYYSPGETARLTLAVTQARAGEISLVSRVSYNGFEEQKTFLLNDKATLTFDVPVTQITGEKLFYGIYHAGGRSLHLNSAAINGSGTVLITTDKPLYNPGDTVSVTVTSADPLANGVMVLSGPGGYSENFSFNGSAQRSIVLPPVMVAGTYVIGCELKTAGGETLKSERALEVSGLQVKITEAILDRGAYSPSDTIKATITIASNTSLSGMLKTWIVDPEGTYTPAGDLPVELSSSKPLTVTHESPIVTSLSGLHRLAYGVYEGDLLLASGSEAFDVGNAMLLGLATDRSDYTQGTEAVTIRASAYGSVDAVLEIQLDGATIQALPVSLNGLVTISNELESTIGPGAHIVKAVLTAGGLSSTKEFTFSYGTLLPDLAINSLLVQGGVRKDSTVEISATVINQGKSASTATTLAFYDGNSLIGARDVKSLSIGESETITFTWNVLGKAGDHTLTASADPRNYVAEFNEKNNDAGAAISVPAAAVSTETDKETYKIRQKVMMTATITNLFASASYQNVTLITAVKDPAGSDVYTKSVALGSLQPSATVTVADIWSTAGLGTDGVYRIVQSVFSGSELVAQSSKPITLIKAPDFSISVGAATSRVRQGEQAVITAVLEALYGWNHEVGLAVEGLPAGTSITFTPDRSVPPFETRVAVTTTSATPPGIHTIYLTARGTDEGEIVVRTAQLTIDVSGFSMETAVTGRTVKQLDPAVFPIAITALNGYDGSVGLSVSGLPPGMRATFNSSDVHAPGTANLTVITSKYAKPGMYAIIVEGSDGLVRQRLSLTITLLANPDIAYGIIATEGPGPRNEALVRVFDGKGGLLREFSAFNTLYGASAVAADMDGDGYDELIVAMGADPKNAAVLRVFKKDGTTMAEYQVGDSAYGLTLASADLDGDWKDELIVGLGPDPKNQGTVSILKYTVLGITEVAKKTIFPEAKNGINVAAGDIDGDGKPEIIVAPGPGPFNLATISAWKYDGKDIVESFSFTASDGTYGLNIAAGDVDGDGTAEIVVATGADPNAAAIVRVYRGDGSIIREFTPYDQKHTYGAYIAVADLDDNGVDEIITGLGPGPRNKPLIKIFTSDGTETGQFLAFPGEPGYGVKVSAGRSPR